MSQDRRLRSPDDLSRRQIDSSRPVWPKSASMWLKPPPTQVGFSVSYVAAADLSHRSGRLKPPRPTYVSARAVQASGDLRLSAHLLSGWFDGVFELWVRTLGIDGSILVFEHLSHGMCRDLEPSPALIRRDSERW